MSEQTTFTPWLLRIERAARRCMFRALRVAVRHLDFKRIRSFGGFLGALQFHLEWIAGHKLARQLAVVLRGSANERAAGSILRQAFRTSNTAVLEILKILDRPQDSVTLTSMVSVSGISRLREALAGGRGAILLGTHSGNSALLLIHLAQCGIPLSITHREAPMMEPGFFTTGIGAYGVEAILANQGLMAYAHMLSALRRNRVLYISIDQGTKRAGDGLQLRFLGKDLPIPPGPAQLARRSRSPVLPVATIADQPQWQFEIMERIELQEESELVQDLEHMLRISEQLILQNPQLWSWHQRRWRQFPLAADVAAGKSAR